MFTATTMGTSAAFAWSIASTVCGITPPTKGEVEAAIAATKTAIEGNDPAEMTAKTQALTEVAMKMGQAIYEKEQAAGASPGAEAPQGDDDVVDAEFSEVDDNKA